MQIITDLKIWKGLRDTTYSSNSLGFVPTMGALHKGHLSLVRRSISENDFTVVSIFLNPTQFDNTNDLHKYPNTIVSDRSKLKKEDVDALLCPDYDQMYPDNYTYKISETEFSKLLCGTHRPGHFDGVLTVVLKLINLVKPRHVYFGEKDYQQFKLISGMVKAFFMDTEIVPCETIREVDGLAGSSRNGRLTHKNRKKAPLFYSILSSMDLNPAEAIEKLQSAGFKVEYVEDIGNRRYGAVYLGEVRLIDNVYR